MSLAKHSVNFVLAIFLFFSHYQIWSDCFYKAFYKKKCICFAILWVHENCIHLWKPWIGFAVCGWVQTLECAEWLARIFICGLRFRKCMRLWFIQKDIYDHAAIVAPIVWLQLTAGIKNLKYCGILTQCTAIFLTF